MIAIQVNKISKNYLAILVVVLLIISVSLAFKVKNLQYENDMMIRNNYSYNLRNFNFTMTDFNDQIKSANTKDGKLKVLDKFSKRLDYINSSLDFRTINDNFKGPIESYVYYLNKVDFEKLRNDNYYFDEVLSVLDQVYSISLNITKSGFEDFFQSNEVSYFNRLKPSKEINDYFEQIDTLIVKSKK